MSGLYPGMDGFDDLLKEYNKPVENNPNAPPNPYVNLMMPPQQTSYNYTSQSNNMQIPSQSQSGNPQKPTQNLGGKFTLQGSSSNFSSSNPYSRFGESSHPPSNTSGNYETNSKKENEYSNFGRIEVPEVPIISKNISDNESPPPEKKNEISDIQHKVNNARLDIFSYFKDNPTSAMTATSNPYESVYPSETSNSNDTSYDYNFLPPEPPQYTLSSQQSTTTPLQQQQQMSSMTGSNMNPTTSTSENPYKDITSKPKYFFPRPRHEVPKEESDEDDYGGNLNEGERRRRAAKRKEMRHKKEVERLMKIRKARLKKFRVGRIRGIFGMNLEDAVIRPYDDPIDEKDEFSCSFLPFPLFKLLSHLDNERFLRRKGLYRTGGSVENLQTLKKQFNKGLDPDLRKYQPNTLTSLVKDYLKSLPDPLIPFSSYTSFMDAALIQNKRFRREELRLSVKRMPNVNFRILKILIGHLKKVSGYKAVNSMDENNLGIVFAPTLIRGENETGMDVLKNTPNKIKIVAHLISEYERIFS